METIIKLFTEIFSDRHGASRYTYQSFQDTMWNRYQVDCNYKVIDQILDLVNASPNWQVVHDSDLEFRIISTEYQNT